MRINQGFGENRVSFYASLGMVGHNGLDLKASMKTETYATFDGQVSVSGIDSAGGEEIRYVSEPVTIQGMQYRLEAVHYHLSKRGKRVGTKVKKGDLIGLTGNSGKYTTGPHLHYGLKVNYRKNSNQAWQKDYTNGYKGAIDPIPFLTSADFERLPVDDRYGRKKSQYAEYLMRFKNRWLHLQFYNRLNRHPLSITNKELNALVYGAWDFETVFLNPAMYVVWTKQTKADYLAKKPFPKPFDQHPWMA